MTCEWHRWLRGPVLQTSDGHQQKCSVHSAERMLIDLQRVKQTQWLKPLMLRQGRGTSVLG